MQQTGSFKFRGALNKVLQMSAEEKRKGVVAASSGNHGLGVALAASLGGTSASIYVPQGASNIKLNAIKDLGATIIKSNSHNCLHAEEIARATAKEKGQYFISPYNDIDVISGQGTIGIELLEQCKDLDAIFISVGGGGLISGVAYAVKQINSKIDIIGCWPEMSPTLYDSLNLGYISTTSKDGKTLSDGTAGGVESNTITLELCQSLITHKLLISEEEIRQAMKKIASYERWIIEGAAAVAVAGLIKYAHQYKDKKIAAIVCGRNISLDRYLKAIN